MKKALTATMVLALAVLAVPCNAQAITNNNLTGESAYLMSVRAAAEKGNAEAQFELGNAYRLGIGVQKNNAEALKWISNAATQGHARAQMTLGLMYHEGSGVAKDDYEANKWYQKAAEQNNADAQDMLGFAYLLGDGVRVDYTQAYKWFNLAAINGDKHAVKDRDELAQYMQGYMITDAKALSDEWQKAHGSGKPAAMALNAK